MNRMIKLMLIGAGLAVISANAFATHAVKQQPKMSYKGEAPQSFCCNYVPPHWYVAGNLGVSHLYDLPAQGSGDSVDQNGPGWDATVGYQFTRIFGAELGYTQYYNSRETIKTAVIARTTHFAAHLNAVGRLPIYRQLDVVGKAGLAYAYAQKVFEASGAAASNENWSPYMGLGLAYELTTRVNMIGQWAFVVGNSRTGSSTLYSLGFEFGIL